jgi:tRNA 2-selenouridine synthase
MAIEKVHIERFLEFAKNYPVLDVRSPGEYKHAHIPGAHSLPLFSDEERKIVGTAYKQQSREEAIKIGLDYFGVKMRKMVEEVESITNEGRTVLVHCWRGGMRSAGVAWLLDLYGFKVYTLVGGYKQFRQYVLATFEIPFQLKIVGGYTGSGKTGLLKNLKEKGQHVIDLEELARHKGSAFGNIGMPEQPGQGMFENILATELHNLRLAKTGQTKSSRFSFSALDFPPIWLEDESQRIGLVNLPNAFWNIMRQAPLWFLDIPFEERLKQIVQEYGQLDQERMIGAIGRITEKLGHLNAKNAVLYLKEGKISESFEILLKYYDKFYLKSLHNRAAINSLLQTVDCKSITPENADLLINQAEFQPQKL